MIIIFIFELFIFFIFKNYIMISINYKNNILNINESYISVVLIQGFLYIK